jgi:hypothetical protein
MSDARKCLWCKGLRRFFGQTQNCARKSVFGGATRTGAIKNAESKRQTTSKRHVPVSDGLLNVKLGSMTGGAVDTSAGGPDGVKNGVSIGDRRGSEQGLKGVNRSTGGVFRGHVNARFRRPHLRISVEAPRRCAGGGEVLRCAEVSDTVRDLHGALRAVAFARGRRGRGCHRSGTGRGLEFRGCRGQGFKG